MSYKTLFIPKLSDRTWIDLIIKIIDTFNDKYNFTININIINLNSISIQKENPLNNEIINDLYERNSTFIEVLSFNINTNNNQKSFGFTLNRNHNQENNQPYFNKVTFSDKNDQSDITNNEKISITELVINDLKVFDPNKTLDTPQNIQLEAIHLSTLERLEQLNTKLAENLLGYRKQLDNDFQAKQIQANHKLDEYKENLQIEQHKELKNIASKQNELDRLKQELDDKSNTHARRALHKNLISEIKARQQRFTLTDGTNAMRKPITYTMFLLIGIFLVASFFSGLELYTILGKSNIDNTQIIIAIIKQSIFSLGAVGSILFYIRWMNRWLEQHAHAEFHLKQFELDMERASWLVETSLEWKDAKGTIIPDHLLNSLSQNLFSNNKPEFDQLSHPADQLASALLGSASSIKLKAGESFIDIDPKKLSKTKIPDNSKDSED